MIVFSFLGNSVEVFGSTTTPPSMSSNLLGLIGVLEEAQGPKDEAPTT